MNDSSSTPSQPASPVPPDDPKRSLALARPNADQTLPHLGVVGDTYTILLTGDDTAGRYTLIDMHVPAGGGPPPHRHDFEEMFTVLDGEIEVTFRGATTVARAGETVNVPANAPHGFRNSSDRPARLLCMCSPPGQEDFFMAIGVPVASRTEQPPSSTRSAERRSSRKPKNSPPSTARSSYNPRRPLTLDPGSVLVPARDRPCLDARQVRPQC
jgi:quercetin dioxygenase-like cupin family protein